MTTNQVYWLSNTGEIHVMGNGPCDTGRCYSPTACGSFGYCRDRNIRHGMPHKGLASRWRREWEEAAKAGRVLVDAFGKPVKVEADA